MPANAVDDHDVHGLRLGGRWGRSAKSTSGGAVCIGEHVIKTYCKQQKVFAFRSAEAELYAMVAASAETLALGAYARDLGLNHDCENSIATAPPRSASRRELASGKSDMYAHKDFGYRMCRSL